MMLTTNKPIVNTRQVQEKAQEKFGGPLDKRFVAKVMRKELRLGYRLAKTVVVQGNT